MCEYLVSFYGWHECVNVLGVSFGLVSVLGWYECLSVLGAILWLT